MIETVIFDFGDTLATLNPSKEEIVYEFLASKGLNLSLENIKYAYRVVDYYYKQSALKLIKSNDKKDFLIKINYELLKVIGLSLKSELWSAELYEYFKSKKRWELFSEVIPVLKRLNEVGYKTAILANWDRRLKDIVKDMAIEKYFSHILCSEEISIEKPDPEIFLYLLKVMALNSEKAIYVGNEYETDVIGARDAGLIPVLIDRNNFWPYADCLRFESLIGLSEYLKRI